MSQEIFRVKILKSGCHVCPTNWSRVPEWIQNKTFNRSNYSCPLMMQDNNFIQMRQITFIWILDWGFNHHVIHHSAQYYMVVRLKACGSITNGGRAFRPQHRTHYFILTCNLSCVTFDILLSSANKLTRQGVTKKDQLSITHDDTYKSCSYHRVT